MRGNQGHGSINFLIAHYRTTSPYSVRHQTINTANGYFKHVKLGFWPVGDILENQWVVLSGLRSLRIASKDGGPSNEYRIQEQSVEFRALDEQGNPYSQMPLWRPLDKDEIKLHFDLQTPVAEWLDKNLYSSAN